MKKLFYIGILCYLVLIIFSCIFFKERVIFTDAANYIVFLTRYGNFYIQHYRYGVILLQLLPILGIKIGASLQSVLFLFSLSYALYYFICYLICGLVLKNIQLAISLLLFNILFATYTFYYMISELPLAVGMYHVLLAYISSRNTLTWKNLLVSFTLLITVVFFHPLSLPIISFSLLFFYFQNAEVLSRKKLYWLAGMYLIIYLIKKLYLTEGYDVHGTEGLHNFKTLFPNYFNLYANTRFLSNCINKYYWIPITFMLIVASYIAKRQKTQLALFVIYTLGYLLLVNVCFPTSYTQHFYMENLYLPLGFFIALPFVFDVLPLLNMRKLAIPVFSLIAISACLRTYAFNTPFSNRLNWERRFLDKHLNEKILMYDNPKIIDTLLMTWATPDEFWMLSTIEYGKSASIIITDEAGNLLWAKDINNKFILTWKQFPYRELPSKYFKFTDSATTYKVP